MRTTHGPWTASVYSCHQPAALFCRPPCLVRSCLITSLRQLSLIIRYPYRKTFFSELPKVTRLNRALLSPCVSTSSPSWASSEPLRLRPPVAVTTVPAACRTQPSLPLPVLSVPSTPLACSRARSRHLPPPVAPTHQSFTVHAVVSTPESRRPLPLPRHPLPLLQP